MSSISVFTPWRIIEHADAELPIKGNREVYIASVFRSISTRTSHISEVGINKFLYVEYFSILPCMGKDIVHIRQNIPVITLLSGT